jgi:hypothetical protein
MEWRINDSGARYPLTIDPLIVNAESLPVPTDRTSFGSNVAVDGDTAVVGDYVETTALGTNVGAVYVFRRSAGTDISRDAEDPRWLEDRARPLELILVQPSRPLRRDQ